MKILIVEQLSPRVVSDRAGLIASADLCIALSVQDGMAAVEAQKQGRWWVEYLPYFEAAVAGHAAWVHRVVKAQNFDREPLNGSFEALVFYGLEIRLQYAVLAQAYLARAAEDHRCPLNRIDLHVVADDPYLRDSFVHRRGIAEQLRSVSLHGMAGSRSWLRRLRERVAASPSIRRLLLAREELGSGDRAAAERGESAHASLRAAALFIQNQRSFEMFEPIREQLLSRGWRVPVFSYCPIESADFDAVSFTDAVKRSPRINGEGPRIPTWMLTDALLAESPVAESSLRLALNVSWLTGWEQIARHRRLLKAQRPSVVISYTIDSVALGLQGAAGSLGIPSLFINHGPEGPVRSPWFFRWSASALAGQPCVEANARGPFGHPQRGLVAVGFPPYDALLARSVRDGQTRSVLKWVRQPEDRPYFVLVFAEYGNRLWVHALQRRMLQMVAEALPHDCFLVCKLHPGGEQERVPSERVLASFLPSQAFAVIGERQHRTPELLAACHVAVASERCMALTDAIFMNRPPIGIRFPEIPPGCNDLNHPARGPEFSRCCCVVRDKDEMHKALVGLTRDTSMREALLSTRKRYIERFYTASDGRAGDRVAALIEHLAEGKDPDLFSAPLGPSVWEH